jgi:glutathione S-transferase
MGKPRLFGAAFSVYVQIARLALTEKQVEYEHVPVDVFAANGIPAWYLEHHPFGRMPAFEHDDFRLYETAAIARYVDEAFEGPALQPSDVRRRATMTQIIGLLDSYGYRPMVWDVYVERIDRPNEGKPSNEALIATGLTKSRTCLAALTKLKARGQWLLGDQLTLADLHAAPMFSYFAKAPEGAAMIAEFTTIMAWWERVRARPSFGIVAKQAEHPSR